MAEDDSLGPPLQQAGRRSGGLPTPQADDEAQINRRFAVGREDKCQLGGPVKIAGMAGQAAKLGFEWLVQLVALLSVGIGILNLLPIPPLDGGHLVFYAAEAVIRRPVSERVMEAVYRTGMILVLAFMAFVFWNDLFGC